MRSVQRGFTIVEILVVIIVIAILASVTIVSYRGAQDRANYAAAQSDLKNINDALVIYKAQKGSYPSSVGKGSGNYVFQSLHPTQFLTELTSEGFLDKMPIARSATNGMPTYVYVSDGVNYKLVRYTNTGSLPSVELTNNPLIDPVRPTSGWGYWTPAVANVW